MNHKLIIFLSIFFINIGMANFVQFFVPSDANFARNASALPALVSPSKSSVTYPVIYTDPSLAIATP